MDQSNVNSKLLIIIIGLLGLTSELYTQELFSYWSFNQLEGGLVHEAMSDSNDHIVGFFDPVPGIKGTALQLDGFTSFLVRNTFEKNLPRHFTITGWLLLEAYPWFRCPVFDLRLGEKQGILLAVKRNGILTAGLGQPMTWTEINGPKVPLKQWVMVSLTVNQGGESALFLNGEKVKQIREGPVLRSTVNNKMTMGRNAVLEEW